MPALAEETIAIDPSSAAKTSSIAAASVRDTFNMVFLRWRRGIPPLL
jgi:hypothetical protein